MNYFPDAAETGSDWETIDCSEAGFGQEVNAAISHLQDLEIDAPTDLSQMLPRGKRHPFDRPLGPLKPRGKPSGLVLRNGYIVAQYGDVHSAEVTFSVTKSYISALAGVASSMGLIGHVNDTVGKSVGDGGFDSSQNKQITWQHMLQQTSEWEGELFGIPDWIDRGREVGGSATMSKNATVGGSASTSNNYRNLETPGTYWEYNDVRVNRTSLALLRLFGRPLPAILKEKIMGPIGASGSWQWHGYETSWVDVDGAQVQSVSGGAHWGGGLWISTLDHARFGLLYLNKGRWKGLQVIPEKWLEASFTPCDINPGYGYLWWLNHKQSISDIADTGAFAARGAGGNIIFSWPARDIVIVLRWCEDTKLGIDSILKTLN